MVTTGRMVMGTVFSTVAATAIADEHRRAAEQRPVDHYQPQNPPVQPNQPTPPQQPAAAGTGDNKDNEGSGSGAVIVIVILLVLVGLAVGAYFMFFAKKSPAGDQMELDDGMKSEV